MPTVRIPTNQITDWNSFHRVFADVMGFPEFYGRNMNAWIDCMSSLDSPDDGMTKIHCAPPDIVVLQLDDVESFRERNREIYDALFECVSFVNERRLKLDEPIVLALSFSRR
jgi:RNAse (barnase) inhibitor barstar